MQTQNIIIEHRREYYPLTHSLIGGVMKDGDKLVHQLNKEILLSTKTATVPYKFDVSIGVLEIWLEMRNN